MVSHKERREALECLIRLEEDLPSSGYGLPDNYNSATDFLSSKYEGLVFEYAGGVIPFQAYGQYRNKYFYFRFRGDRVSLHVGDASGDAMPANAVVFSIENYTGNPLEGSMNLGEFQYAFEQLFEKFLKL